MSRAVAADPASDATVDIVIVGGGATGVELAAELHMSADSLAMYGLEVFDAKRLRTVLVEAGPRILPALPEKLAAAARTELEAIGVRVFTDEMVTAATAGGIVTKRGDVIAADLMVWAAGGVKGAGFMHEIGGLETTRGNQIVVRPTLQTTRDERIFAIGDCASYVPPGATRPVPPRAQTAHQMADIAYHNIRAMIAGKTLKPFMYQDHGSVVSLGTLCDRRKPDGQPRRRQDGGRGAAGALCLYVAVPDAPDRDPRLAARAVADRHRSRQRHRPAEAQAALTGLRGAPWVRTGGA